MMRGEMERSLLILVGASSSLAIEVGRRLVGPYTFVVPLSRQPGIFETATKQYEHVVYDPANLDALVELFSSSFFPDRVEVDAVHVVSFAGTKDRTVLVNMSAREIDAVIESNLVVNINIAQSVLRTFRGKSISMVFMSSSGAIQGDAGTTVYSACKYALLGVARGLSIEYGRFGLRANVIELGVLPVGLKESVPERRLEEMRRRTALRREVSLESVLKSILFLIENDDITGAAIRCDGGYF